MASYLVPDSPAVTDALERLRELDKELREDGIAFSAEASFHLSQIAAALTELEGHQRAAQEALEAESTENSKMAQRVNNAREAMREEIMAEVAAVRTCGAAERDQLQNHLMEVSQLQDATTKRQEDLRRQTETLHAEKQRAKAEHAALVAALNEQVNIKNGLQVQLDRRQEQIEELASCSATAQQDKIQLQKRTELQREAFSVRQERVCREAEQVEEDVRQQKQVVRRARKALAQANDAKLEVQERLRALTFQMAVLESSLQRATASRSQCETQLERQTQTHQQLKEKKELLEKDLHRSKVTSSTLIQRLKDEISTLERETEDAQASRELHGGSLAHVCQTLKHQQGEESEARADLLRAEQQLQKSKLQLEQRVASIARHRSEIREMDEQMTALRRADTARQRLFERDLQEVSSTLEAQRRTVVHLEEEKTQLAELLEAARSQQEERVAKVTSDIRSTERRYQELLQEEAALQEQQQPRRLDADLLRRRLKQRETKYREEEARRRQEVERFTTDADTISQSNQERQRQVEEEEERLKEVQAAWRVEELRHTRMTGLVEELQARETDLERMLVELKEKSSSLLQPRRAAKAQVEEVRRRYMEMLQSHTSELRAAEMSTYDCELKVEQVRMENSRFQLCIGQMMEDQRRAEEDGDRYREETRLMGQELQDVMDSLQRRWREDVSATRHHQSRDGRLLTEMDVARRRLRARREELGALSRRWS